MFIISCAAACMHGILEKNKASHLDNLMHAGSKTRKEGSKEEAN